jgi:ATP-dependent phosphoenolpyruvate carboxykinase
MQIPTFFNSICGVAGYSEDKVKTLWLDINEKTLTDLLIWLVNEGNLTDKQLLQLEEIYKQILNHNLPDVDATLLDVVGPILDSQQLQAAIKKQSELFLEHLENVYNQIKRQMSIAQKQVADAYVNNSYAGI